MPGNAKLLLDMTLNGVSSTLPALPKKAFKKQVQDDDRDDETATTDVGSTCSSDAESTTSAQSLSARSTGPLGLPLKAASRGRGVFRGTQLETIPGTPIAATYLESGSLEPSSVFSFPTSPTKSAKLVNEDKKHFQFPHECSADESEPEGMRVSIEDLQQSLRNDSLPLPLPRSPRRRSKLNAKVAVPAPGQECPALSTTMTSMSINPFSTVPMPRPNKKRSRQLAERPLITSVMSGSLSTAPITPCPRSPKRRAPQATAMAVMSDAETSGCGAAAGIFGTVPAAVPQSPKKRAREALFASAKREGIPLKVKLSDLEAGLRRSMNPALPAKKRPVFAEFAGSEAALALRRLEPGMPVKKCVPSFLLEDPPRAMRPPPGLVMAR